MEGNIINPLALDSIHLVLEAYSSKYEKNKEAGSYELLVHAKTTLKKIGGETISPALECVSLARTLLSLEMFALLYRRRSISYVNDSTILVSLDVTEEDEFLFSLYCGETKFIQEKVNIYTLNIAIRDLLTWLSNIAVTHGQKNWILNCIALQAPQDKKPEGIM